MLAPPPLLILHPLLLRDASSELWARAHTRGAENRGSGEAAGPDGGRRFGTRELARGGRAQVWYILSEVSSGRRFTNVARL